MNYNRALLLLVLCASTVGFAADKKASVVDTLSKPTFKHNVYTITHDQILASGKISLVDILNSVPGLAIQNNSSFTHYNSQSFLGLSNGAQYLINGRPITNESWESFGLQQFSVSNIERIEVIRHNTSPVFGPNFGTGIINIITKSPTNDPTIDSSLHVENDTAMASAFASQRLNNIAYSVQTQITNTTAHDENGDNFTDTPKINRSSYSGQIDLYQLFNPESKLSLDVRQTNETRKSGDIRDIDNAQTANNEHVRTEETAIGVSYEQPFSEANVLKLYASEMNTERYSTNQRVATTAIPNPSFNVKDKKQFASIQIETPLHKDHQVIIGSDVSRSTVSEIANSETGHRKFNNIGFYAHDTWTLSPRMRVTAAGRMDRQTFDDTNSDSEFYNFVISPTITFGYDHTRNLSSFFSTGVSYKAPQLFAEAHQLNGEVTDVFTPSSIKPQQHHNISAGAIYKKGNYELQSNVYYSKIQNVLETNLTTEPGFDFEWTNIGDASSVTTELLYYHKLTPFLSFNGEINYTFAELDNFRPTLETVRFNKKLFKTPDFTSRIQFTTYNPILQTSVQLGFEYIGLMYVGNDTDGNGRFNQIKRTQPFIITTVSARREYFLKSQQRLTVYTGIKNLFDIKQPDFPAFGTNVDSSYVYAPLRGRYVYAGASIDF